MKVAMIGHFALNKEYNDGQTVKVKNLYKELEQKIGENNIFKVDTYNYKKHPIKLFSNCVKAMKADNVMFLPAQNGVKVFIPLLCFLNKFYKKNLFYIVVGGWLPEKLEDNKLLLKTSKKITKIFVETEGMKKKLNNLGLNNVEILLNFKKLSPIAEEEFKRIDYENIKVCTFSRVIKEKGIENAINVVNNINKKYNKKIYHLDIYGPIGEEYKEEFEKIIATSDNSYICYKGVVNSSKSVEIIKQYDLLLFPTYYEGEGLAGTIIDAFFAGVPVVASDWRYNRDVINDSVNGIIFKTNDDSEFEKILNDIHLQKYDINEMKKACIQEAIKYLPEIAIMPLMKHIDNPKRLLCIVSGMNRGGAETFLMKLYRAIDKNKYQMDFCVTTTGVYDEEIKSMGGKIFFIPLKSKNPLKSFLALKKIVKENGYKSVLRTSQQSLATLDLIAAKMGGATKLIYRSSNAGLTGGKISRLVNSLFSFLPKIIPNIKIAPSTESAKFVFGDRAVKNNKVIIMHNCLDYNVFKFNNEIRNRIREQLKIVDKTVYGHVGRFNVQKNHNFLLDIFDYIKNKDRKSVFLIIGEGELEEEIKTKIHKLGMEENVILIGPQKNINEYLMAMDILIFPSFFEGMPNVVIEAQATGLPCVLSNNITREAEITNLLSYIDLNEPVQFWGDTAIKKSNIRRENYENDFRKKGYIIDEKIGEYIKYLF